MRIVIPFSLVPSMFLNNLHRQFIIIQKKKWMIGMLKCCLTTNALEGAVSFPALLFLHVYMLEVVYTATSGREQLLVHSFALFNNYTDPKILSHKREKFSY